MMLPDYLCPQFPCVLTHAQLLMPIHTAYTYMHTHTIVVVVKVLCLPNKVKIPILAALESKFTLSLYIDCVCQSCSFNHYVHL